MVFGAVIVFGVLSAAGCTTIQFVSVRVAETVAGEFLPGGASLLYHKALVGPSRGRIGDTSRDTVGEMKHGRRQHTIATRFNTRSRRASTRECEC